MNNTCRNIFRAIHEGKWLKIEYKNKAEQITKYWIGIRDLDPVRRTLKVDGLHVGKLTIDSYDKIFIDSICASEIIEGSYCERNQTLINDISFHPEKYITLFHQIANLKILNYLELCNRLDTTPYFTEFELIQFLDRERFSGGEYALSDEQFQQIVQRFQFKNDYKEFRDGRLKMQQLAMNVLSIHTAKGLYVLAYRKLFLDVKNRTMKPDEEITICTQFLLGGKTESVRRFLDANEYELLNDFEKNQEAIKDAIAEHHGNATQIDDMPYVIGLGMDVAIDLHKEYKAIYDMYQEDKVTYPIKAFFGELLERPRRVKAYPIALINQNINLDQLLAINNAMKYPCAYIQGPPGTGKTNTIKNTIITAFFNETTVLFASYNNIPIDNVFDNLRQMEYKGKIIPFPILRLGNVQKIKAAIDYINQLRKQVKTITVFDSTLDKRKDVRKDRAKKLSYMLKDYEEYLDLNERKDTLEHLMEYQNQIQNAAALFPFQLDLQTNQKQQIETKMNKIGYVTEEKALELLDRNEDEFYQYLLYTSAKYIKQLETNRFADLRKILDYNGDIDTQVDQFNKYLQKSENVKKLQKVFPIMITTCISAHRLGEAETLFDMTILDEASQCNVAISLVPILRGNKLMLVGDPQQLKPVVLLDEISNRKLRDRYHVADEYDYIQNSIYKTFLACDAVSDEVLLHNHYRCNEKIIGFNNKKFRNC